MKILQEVNGDNHIGSVSVSLNNLICLQSELDSRVVAEKKKNLSTQQTKEKLDINTYLEPKD